MKISVVIPALNEEANIARAIDSSWNAGADEVIVADGGSADKTLEHCDAATSVVTSSPGRAFQMNAGAAIATGKILLFLHADNWLGTECLKQVHSALEVQRIVGGSFRQRIDASGFGYRWLEWGNSFRANWFRLPFGDQAIFIRREHFEQLGGYEEVPLLEDVRLMRSLRKKGKLALLKGPVHISSRRWEKHGPFRQTFRNWWILAMHKFGVPPEKLAQYYHRHDK